ncbi:MAG: methylenetetrahydrofolate reductase [NAD(P)H] [Candidatus Zixiibacteriota bacterium]|nr:MAG: methylenetetrahydrofolate reductase [NAD(P)H] [candidate division Zixibacteria bacterium]
MYVTEHLSRAQNPLFSYEIIPPQRGKSARDILDIVEQLQPYNPPFIDVTSHCANAYYEELGDGTLRRRIRRKRPGTMSICGIIQNRYNIDTVPHLLCRGFTREETEDAVIELGYLGIHNVLVIRGDDTNYVKPVGDNRTTNIYSTDLVRQLADLKEGKYLEEIANPDSIEMCIGVAGHPEKHVESPNLTDDIMHLKEKVAAGADYIVTQMFFDSGSYFKFVEKCRKAGIEVPIIPGLKILSTMRQLTSLPKNFHISIPEELVNEISENRKHVKEIGIRWAVRQCRELLEGGVKCVHFFIMNDAMLVTDVVKQLS